MKKLILPAILLLPVASLLIWCYYGARQPRLPVGTYNQPTNVPVQTNVNSTQGTN